MRLPFSRKENKLSTEKEDKKWVENFNDSLYHFNSLKDSAEMSVAAENLAGYLTALRTNETGTWPTPVRSAILKLVSDIGQEFDKGTPEYKTSCTNLLRLVYTRRDSAANAKVIKRFKDSFEKKVSPELQLDRGTLLLRQEMHDFGKSFMTKLLDQAIRTWSPQRFELLWRSILVDQLKRRDLGGFDQVKEHLRRIWQDPKESVTIHDRALWILNEAKEVD